MIIEFIHENKLVWDIQGGDLKSEKKMIIEFIHAFIENLTKNIRSNFIQTFYSSCVQIMLANVILLSKKEITKCPYKLYE